MATSINCWKCLARPCATSSSRICSVVSSKSFSTTSPKLVGGPKPFKKSAPAGVKQSLKIKKKTPQKTTGRPPASGERKAMRKRVVLSNTNALEVSGMQEFNKDLVGDMLEGGEEQKSLACNVVALPGETVDTLRAIDAFKPTQGWGLFRKPGLLIRQESVELTRALVSAEDEKSTLRYVIEGSKGSGKSMMLLHAQAVAIARGWVVLHLPEGMFFSTHKKSISDSTRSTRIGQRRE
jgi:small subunit ribosomal protein S29